MCEIQLSICYEVTIKYVKRYCIHIKENMCKSYIYTNFPTGTKNVYELAFINLFLKIVSCKFIDLIVVRVILKRFTYL